MKSVRELYELFCSQNNDVPLFHQPFYLDAVCGGRGNWSAVVSEKGGRTVGIWPFYLKKFGGWRYVAMPDLCRLMGPFFSKEVAGKEGGLLKGMIPQLPKLAAFEQDFHYQNQNWLPFHWRGFRQTTRFSYRIPLGGGLESVWQNVDADYRNNKIRRAAEVVRLREDATLDEFWRVHSLGLGRQGQRLSFDFHFLKNLDDGLAAHSSRRIFIAEDAAGNAHSAAYLVWDKETAYLLMAGDDPGLRSSGAGIWLTWELVKFSHDVLRVSEFDFLGSMVEGIERVRRNFGAEQRPYFRIQKEWSAAWRVGKFLLR